MRAARDVLPTPVVLPMGGVPPPRRRSPFQERREGHAVALGGNLGPEGLADRRHHVDVLGERIDDAAVGPGTAHVAHDTHHVVARLEAPTLAEQPLVAQLLAVVRRHHDEGVVPHAQGHELVPHPSELLVDVGDHPEVLGAQGPHRPLVARGAVAGQIPGERRRPLGCGRGSGDVVGVVGRRPPPGRGVGRVRAPVAGIREPRGVLATQPGDEVVGEERRDAVLGGALGFGGERTLAVGGHVVAERCEPGPPRPLVVGELEADLEARRVPLVARQAPVAGVGDGPGVDALVGVAEHRRGVPGPAGDAGDVVQTPVQRRPVADHAVVHLVRPGVEARPPRAAGCRLAVVARQTGARRRQPVERRGAHDGMPGGAQAITAELVEGDEQDVHGTPPALDDSTVGRLPTRCPARRCPRSSAARGHRSSVVSASKGVDGTLGSARNAAVFTTGPRYTTGSIVVDSAEVQPRSGDRRPPDDPVPERRL